MRDLFSLNGRIAFVAGASREMGGAVARTLAEYGADVAVAARTANQLEKVAADIRAMGRRALAVTADLTQVEQIGRAIDRTVEQLGGLDILVNIIGGSGAGETGWALRMTEPMWDNVLTLNLKAPMFLSQAAARVMKERGGGSIVNISSTAGTGASPRLTNYAASKAGLENLTESLAAEWAQFKIRVNVVVSGNVETASLTPLLTPAVRKQLVDRTPLGRLGTGDDIAAAVLYLVSPAADWVTGTRLVVDGGLGNIRPFDKKVIPGGRE